MKRILLSLLFLTSVFTSAIAAVGTGNDKNYPYSEVRNVATFNTLKSTGSVDVEYIQSTETKVIVYGQQSTVEKITTTVKDNTLTIGVKKGVHYITSKTKVVVMSPSITAITLAGSGDLKSPEINTQNLNINDYGSGDIEIDKLSVSNAEIKSCGSGDIEIEMMSAGNVGINLSGSGDIDLGNFVIGGVLSITDNGSGDVELEGKTEKLTIVLNGSGDVEGDVKYQSIERRCNGSGRIHL